MSPATADFLNKIEKNITTCNQVLHWVDDFSQVFPKFLLNILECNVLWQIEMENFRIFFKFGKTFMVLENIQNFPEFIQCRAFINSSLPQLIHHVLHNSRHDPLIQVYLNYIIIERFNRNLCVILENTEAYREQMCVKRL